MPKDETSGQVVAQRRNILTTKAHIKQNIHTDAHLPKDETSLLPKHLDNQGSEHTPLPKDETS